MKQKLKIVISFFFLTSIMNSCGDDEKVLQFPKIKTLQVTEITSEGVTFNAQISRSGLNIDSYGFSWTDKPKELFTKDAEYIEFKSSLKSNEFEKRISTTLKENVTYFVKGFVTSEGYTVYGEAIQFVSLGSGAPEIENFEPSSGTIADTVIIHGANFSRDGLNSVYFNNKEASIIKASDSTMQVLVPIVTENILNISVSILGNIAEHEEKFKVVSPKIDSFSPESLGIDDTIRVYGSNFSYLTNANILKIDTVLARVLSATKNELVAITPTNLRIENNVVLTIANQSTVAGESLIFLEPIFEKFNVESTDFGETVEFIGAHLSPVIDHNKMSLDGQSIEIINASRTALSFVVPDDFFQCPFNIEVEVAGRKLRGSPLCVAPPEILRIEPEIITDINETFTIHGKYFNPQPSQNKVVRLGNTQLSVRSSTNTSIEVSIPVGQHLIPYYSEISVFDKKDLVVQVLNQSDSKNDFVDIQYESTWTPLADFPGESRGQYKAVLLNGNIYFGFGHIDFQIDQPTDFWKYDVIQNNWTRLADFPKNREDLGNGIDSENNLFVSDNEIYGYLAKGIWKYDTVTNNWIELAQSPNSDKMYSEFSFVLENIVYVGYDTRSFCCGRFNFYSFDLDKKEWFKLGDIPSDLESSLFTEILSNTPYLFSAHYGGHKVFSYDSNNDSWTLTNISGISNSRSVIDIDDKWYYNEGRMIEYDHNQNTVKYYDMSLAGKSGFLVADGDLAYVFFLNNDGIRLWRFKPN